MTKPIVVACFSFPHEAQIARASLECAGIPAMVVDEHTINMQWLYSHAIGGVKVLVPPECEQEAKDVLNTDFSATVDAECDSDKAVCPSCSSYNIEPFTRGKVPAYIVFLLLGFPLFFYQHGLKCNDCGEFTKT